MVDTTVVVEAAVVAAAVAAAMEATTLEAVILMLAVVTPWAALVLAQCMTVAVDLLPTPVPDQLADEEIWEDLVPCVDPIHMQRKCLTLFGIGGTVCSNGFYADISNQHHLQQLKSCLKSFL